VPLQRVSVAQGDHTTAGGHRRHSVAGGFSKRLSIAIAGELNTRDALACLKWKGREKRLQVPASPNKTLQHTERTDDIRDREALDSDMCGERDARDHAENFRSLRQGEKESVPLQRVSVAQSDQRQLEGTDAILMREAFSRGYRARKRRQTIKTTMACKEEDGLRLCHSNRLELHSATIRSWRATTPFLTGRLYKVALAVHWSHTAIGSAFQCFKRQGRVGANPKGHGRPGRPYDNEREVLAILDRRSHFGPESCTRWPWTPIGSAKLWK